MLCAHVEMSWWTDELMNWFAAYGDIMMVETTGASVQTAQQDKLKCSGERGSIHL